MHKSKGSFIEMVLLDYSRSEAGKAKLMQSSISHADYFFSFCNQKVDTLQQKCQLEKKI